jgi:ribose 5-phosphate isomerase B
VIGPALAWELVETFLKARFSGAERHQRRVDKVRTLEIHPAAHQKHIEGEVI